MLSLCLQRHLEKLLILASCLKGGHVFPWKATLRMVARHRCCSLEPNCYLFFCCFIWMHICFIHVGTCPERTCRACRGSFELKGWGSNLSTFILLALLSGNSSNPLEPKLARFKIRMRTGTVRRHGRLLLLLSSHKAPEAAFFSQRSKGAPLWKQDLEIPRT